LRFRHENTRQIDSKEDFHAFFTPPNPERPEIHGGFAYTHWCGNQECEEKIKTDLGVTIRCIPLNAEKETGRCIACGDKSTQQVVFAKAY
jgi:prolyl-tRNA synthetase